MAFSGFTGSNLPTLRDDFNRADNAVLGDPPWREGDAFAGFTCQILSNQVAPGAAGLQIAQYRGIAATHNGMVVTLSTFSVTAYAHVFNILQQNTTAAPIELFTVAANSIEVWYDNTTLKGTISLSASFATGDQVGVEVDRPGADNIYTIHRRAGAAGNWAQVGTFTDTASARSGPFDMGIGFFDNTTARFDDFYAEEITAAAGGSPRFVGAWSTRSGGL